MRVSHSILDPYLKPLVPRLYRALRIPPAFPPEGIVILGHLVAVGGAFAFAYSTRLWWTGLVAAIAVGANHFADMVDGTHARATRQCRNGGELLDHFVDPLSFSFWMVGIAVSCDRLDLALAAVILIYATSVLTNIRAKLTGEFTLSRFGPTEFKALLAGYGLFLLAAVWGWIPISPARGAFMFLAALVAVGILQLAIGLFLAIREVNRSGTPPDQSEWQAG